MYLGGAWATLTLLLVLRVCLLVSHGISFHFVTYCAQTICRYID
jgi:hypothetical protein